jgi:hypothetical protein
VRLGPAPVVRLEGPLAHLYVSTLALAREKKAWDAPDVCFEPARARLRARSDCRLSSLDTVRRGADQGQTNARPRAVDNVCGRTPSGQVPAGTALRGPRPAPRPGRSCEAGRGAGRHPSRGRQGFGATRQGRRPAATVRVRHHGDRRPRSGLSRHRGWWSGWSTCTTASTRRGRTRTVARPGPPVGSSRRCPRGSRTGYGPVVLQSESVRHAARSGSTKRHPQATAGAGLPAGGPFGDAGPARPMHSVWTTVWTMEPSLSGDGGTRR